MEEDEAATEEAAPVYEAMEMPEVVLALLLTVCEP